MKEPHSRLIVLTLLLCCPAALKAFLSTNPDRGQDCDFALVWGPVPAKGTGQNQQVSKHALLANINWICQVLEALVRAKLGSQSSAGR